jgi:anthranilate phosphoribosyltransferase
MSAAMKPFLQKLASGQPLTRAEAEDAFGIIMSGEATASQIGAFLMALRVRGETVHEIAGAVSTMRGKMLKVEAPDGAMDIVGTGGDSSGSWNVSTASAFVVAGCGVPVAKHGNRALTSRSGAADTLAALGVNLELGPEGITKCIDKAGIGFMFAPAHHAAMRHVGPARVELGTRTIFNLLGPLSNPAGVKRQLLGVFAPEWVEPLAHVLNDLGCEAAWVVHGDGLDEMTLTGVTKVAELKDGKVRCFDVTPEDAGLPRADHSALKGGDSAHNSAALRSLLDGAPGAYRDITLLNSAAALIVAGRTAALREGVEFAAESIDSGKALAALDRLIAVSNGQDA